MANTVFKLRRSSVAGKQPNTSTLAIGELALNLTDRKLYSSDGTNVWETGANLTNLAVTANATVNNLIVTGGLFANGNDGSSGQVLTSNGTGVYWSSVSGGGGGSILDVRQQYTADGVTNTFTVEGGYSSNSLSVYLNGVLLRNGVEVNVLDGDTFSFTTAPANGALIDIVGISALYANGTSTVVSQQFTANGSANSFTISGGYLPNKVQVYLNGVKQVPGTDVILTSGSTVNFIATPANNFIVDVFGYQSDIIAYLSANQNLQYTWTNTHNFTNTVTLTSLSANGGYGTAGQALTTNGSAVYWSTIVGTNTDAQYVWSNTHTFNANVNVNAALIANGTAGIASQVLTTNGSGIYWSSAGVNTAAQYTWTNTQTFSNTITFNSVINGTANAANYLGGNSASDLRNYSDTTAATAYSNAIAYSGNSVAAYTNAVSYTDSKILTANSAITGNAATAYSNAVSYTDSKILTANSAITGNAATAYTNAVAYVDGKSYVNTSQLTNNLSNYALLSGATFTGNVVANNANTTYDLNVGRNLTVGGNLTITGNVTIIGANNLSIVDNFIYLNSNNTTQNVDLGWAGNYNDGSYHHAGFFRDASDGVWKVFDNYDPEPDANVNIDTTNTSFHIANFQANAIYVGNTSVYSTVNTTNFTGTSNNTLFVGSVSAANVVSNAQLSANLGNYQTTAGLSANVATLTANLANYVVANDGIVSNSSGVFVKAGTGITVNATGVHATVSGVNTAAQYTWTNVQTFNANLVIGTSSQIIANGSFGSNGQVIVSNGTGVYWSNSYTTGTRQNFTGTGACTTFTVSGGYVPQQADVYVNGVKISNTTADVSSGSTIVFSSAPVNGAEIQFVGIQPLLYTFANTSAQYNWTNTQTFSNLVMNSSAGISANGSYGTNGQVLTSNGTSVFWSNSATYVRQTFTGTGACTTFQVTGGYTPNNLDVYVTGVKQLSTTDVDISSGNNIVFTIAPVNNAPIEVVGVIPLLYSYANQTYSYTWTNTHTFSNGTATATVNASLISIGNSSVNTQIVAGNVFLNGSTLVIGNTASNISINSTAISVGTVQLNATSFAGTANNASYLGGTAAASYALTSSLSSYQTTAGLSANVATLTANNTSFVGSISAANVVSNAQLSANLGNYVTTTNLTNNLANYTTTTNLTNNLANYQTTSGLSSNVATLTANNTSFVGSVSAANVVSNAQLSANLSNYQTTAGLSANVATLTSNNANNLGGSAAANYLKLSWTGAQTVNFSASAGKAYPVSTSAGAVTVTLPASPAAGDVITILDYGGVSSSNNITINANGNKINGYSSINAIINTNRGSYTLVYIDSTQGWINQASTTQASVGLAYTVNYLVVAGGGGGGYSEGGGGGAGGFRTGTMTVTSGTGYTVTVGGGGGGAAGNTTKNNGSDSAFSSVTSTGGGAGGNNNSPGYINGNSGGSGGGGRGYFAGAGGAGNTPSVSPSQGNNGGSGNSGGTGAAGGGGGAGGTGGNASSGVSGNGGAGSASSITGTSVTYAGGGGGGNEASPVSSGGSGGGANGGSTTTNAQTAPSNLGGGGGGGGYPGASQNGGNGGSGVVIISYASSTQLGSGGTVTTSGGNYIHTFTSGGTFTA